VTEPKIINHFGLSSGKDSTALWGWAFNESGYDPATIRGSFADTENEYDEVYEQIKVLSDYGVKRGAPPVATLRSVGFLNLAIKKKRFPSAKARFCTEILKIFPARNYLLAFVWLMGCEVVSHTGVRRDESTERSLLSEWGENEWGKVRRPLLDWKVADVWAAHKRYGLPINPLYFEGRKRVGCKLCCMSSKSDIRITAKKRPATIDLYREWEKKVGAARGQIASFFRATTLPERFRSQTYTNKKGETFAVATIDDAVEWAKTLKGAKQRGFDFMYEEDDAHLPCNAGYCE
jgi:3'-phosphoadenosine 5'-phosphosulfate sulfotransferase (PAPS reductase)/FAD synthetase